MQNGNRYNLKKDKSYFLTMTVVDWVDLFTRPSLMEVITDSLNYCVDHKGLNIFGWCLMPSHLHLMANTDYNVKLSDVVRDFKKFTNKKSIETIKTETESRRKWLLDKFQYNARIHPKTRDFKVWQDGNHAIEVYSEKFTWQKLNYIHNNPVEAKFVANPQDYYHSSARDYYGLPSLVKVNCITPPVVTASDVDFFRR
jgi:REP element-mobilizing transposase RayT